MEEPRIRVLELFFLLVVVALSYGIFMVLRPFVLDIFLAAVFTSILSPTHERLASRLGGHRAISALVMVLMVFVVVAIPVTMVTILVYSEAVSGYGAFINALPGLTTRLSQISILDWASHLPVIGDYVSGLQTIDLSELFRQAVSGASNFVLNATQKSFLSASAALAHFILVLLLMFFLFHAGRRFVAAIYKSVPLPNRELREIAEETRRTTGATLTSTLVIGIIEGTYGAILFLVFGLPSAFLWGIIIMILSMIPLIGTNLVLIPAGVVLIVTGHLGRGIAMIVLGLAGVAATQNVIKPKLLGERAGLHPAIALLATIGGIAWLGLIGFLVGPLIAALFVVVWRQFGTRYRDELATRNRQGSRPTQPPQ
jgi:predicted PurR-regulated permease PerM